MRWLLAGKGRGVINFCSTLPLPSASPFPPLLYLAVTQHILVLFQWLRVQCFTAGMHAHVHTGTQIVLPWSSSPSWSAILHCLCAFFPPVRRLPIPQVKDEVSSQLEVTPVDCTNGPKLGTGKKEHHTAVVTYAQMGKM